MDSVCVFLHSDESPFFSLFYLLLHIPFSCIPISASFLLLSTSVASDSKGKVPLLSISEPMFWRVCVCVSLSFLLLLQNSFPFPLAIRENLFAYYTWERGKKLTKLFPRHKKVVSLSALLWITGLANRSG